MSISITLNWLWLHINWCLKEMKVMEHLGLMRLSFYTCYKLEKDERWKKRWFFVAKNCTEMCNRTGVAVLIFSVHAWVCQYVMEGWRESSRADDSSQGINSSLGCVSENRRGQVQGPTALSALWLMELRGRVGQRQERNDERRMTVWLKGSWVTLTRGSVSFTLHPAWSDSHCQVMDKLHCYSKWNLGQHLWVFQHEVLIENRFLGMF